MVSDGQNVIADLSFAENKSLKLSTEIRDAKLNSILAWIKCNLELRSGTNVTDPDYVPGRLWWLPCPESADE